MGRKRGECTGYVLGRGGEWRRCPGQATEEWGGRPVCRRHYEHLARRAMQRTPRARAEAAARLEALLAAAGVRP